MADGKKGSLARLGVLVVVLAAAGAFFLYKQNQPPRGGNLERMVLEDSAGLRGKSLDDVKKAFHHNQPEPGAEEGVWVFDFSKVDPGNPAKVEVVIRRGVVASMRELDDRVPAPKPALKGEPDPSQPSETPPEPAPAGGGENGGSQSGG